MNLLKQYSIYTLSIFLLSPNVGWQTLLLRYDACVSYLIFSNLRMCISLAVM